MNQPENDIKSKMTDAKDKKAIMKYAGAGFQIVAPVLLGVLVGTWLDNYFETRGKLYTIVLSSLMIVLALYLFLKQFFKS
ncbi:MAG: AtpZ/AtpI family protein [Bacteroidota bacterium]|nr:AtpZ/AtpI family protein [Bacteroidota bacterium]